jgi:pilus assembly protein CpaE
LARILIVDDDPDLLRLVEYSLVRAGHNVITARDGDEGLTAAFSDPPDLAIVDIMMPRMHGYELCRRLRQDSRTERTPILVFTARSQEVDRAASLAAGATDFLGKSANPNELVERVEKLLAAVPALHKGPGRALGCFSLRGGAGVTSLAINVAVALALSRREEVPVLDLAPLGGHAALMLSLSTKRSWADLPFGDGELMAKQLTSLMPRHFSGVRVLTSPMTPTRTGVLSEERTHLLLRVARQAFSRIVIDIPPILNEVTVTALREADRILLVVTPEVASLQSAKIALESLQQMGLQDEQVLVVLNQTFVEEALEATAVESAIKRPLAVVIPYMGGALVQSINSGKPFMLSRPSSPAASAIARLAARATEGW